MSEISKKVVVRFPPSPTGNFHIGSARTALFNYLFAKHAATKGIEAKIILRFEDTDRERSKKEYEKNILDGLDWLDLKLETSENSKPYRQSEHGDMYQKYLKQIVESGHAYLSKETPKEAGQRAEVIRFKNPNIKVTFHDLIRGDITFDTTELGDFVIAKNFDEPLYHLAVVVDDYEMGITHVIRGEDHISNTPRQILIQRALAASGAVDLVQPLYAHIPLILAPDRSKMSKRHGAVSMTEYQQKGYLPQAMVNYLATLGWNPGTAQEIFSMDELIAQFDLSKVQKSGAIFNEEKLRWINKEYLKKIPTDERIEMLRVIFTQANATQLSDQISTINSGSLEKIQKILGKIEPLIFERAETLNDLQTAPADFSYFFIKPKYETSALLWKGQGDLIKTKIRLQHVTELINKISDLDFTADKIKAAIWEYATSEGRGDVLWPLRMSLSGREKSPDPFQLLEILGKEESSVRIQDAIKKLN
jgi:glutamyl-tRNA synthetase